MDEDKELTDAWYDTCKKYLLEYSSETIDIAFQTHKSRDEELDHAILTIIPWFCVSFAILLVFAVLSSLMVDWVYIYSIYLTISPSGRS